MFVRNSLLPSLLVGVLWMSPGHAESGDPSSFIANDSFFDGMPAALDSEILMVVVDAKSLPHGDADAELIQYPQPDAERRQDSCGLDSSPPVPFTLDCGVKMLGLDTRGDQAVYYFLLKAHRGDWYQIVLSPQSGATTWIKDQREAGLELSVHPLRDWLKSQDSYQTAQEITDPVRAVPVMTKPRDTSEDLTDCASYADGEGLVAAADKATNGDWIHVTCIENQCYSVHDPLRACLPQLNVGGVPCTQGWARWRAQDGRVLLYPNDALPQGCS